MTVAEKESWLVCVLVAFPWLLRGWLIHIWAEGLPSMSWGYRLYCTKLNSIRSDFFAYCNQINCKFMSMSQSNKLVLLNTDNIRIIHFLFKMYKLRHSLLFATKCKSPYQFCDYIVSLFWLVRLLMVTLKMII